MIIRQSYSFESPAQYAYNEPNFIFLRHALQVLPPVETGLAVRRQFSIFVIILIFETFLIQMTFSSNYTYTMTAFYYSLKSITQCASNESNSISLRHSVQVLPSNEKGHDTETRPFRRQILIFLVISIFGAYI